MALDRAGEGDVVITDVALPDENSLDLLPRIRSLRPDLPVIVMSAQNTLLTAVRATERGAFEYLPKPFDIGNLVAAVQRSLQPNAGTAAGRRAAICPRSSCRSSAARRPMQEIYRIIARLIGTDLTVLIAGEVRHRQGAGGAGAARFRQAHAAGRSSPSTWRQSRAS